MASYLKLLSIVPQSVQVKSSSPPLIGFLETHSKLDPLQTSHFSFVSEVELWGISCGPNNVEFVLSLLDFNDIKLPLDLLNIEFLKIALALDGFT